MTREIFLSVVALMRNSYQIVLPKELNTRYNGMERDQFKRSRRNLLCRRNHEFRTVFTCPQLRTWLRRTQDIRFMQDGAPCHKSKMVMDYFRSNKINLLDWLGNSPDITPIENVWAVLKQELSKRNVTNKEDLIKNIKDVWKNSEKVRNAAINGVKSMKIRIQMLLKSKGQWIKY